MVSRFSTHTPTSAAGELLSAASDAGPVYAINQPVCAIRAVVRAAAERESLPEIRLVCERSSLAGVREAFPVATQAAALIEDGRLSIRRDEQLRVAPVFVTSEGIRTLMQMADVAAHGGRTSGAYVDRMLEQAPKLWAAAESFTPDTPPRDRVLATAGELSEPLADELATAIEAAGSDQLPFDPVGTALVVAAEHELLYADVRRWLTSVGVASAATVSRRKRTLEDAGFLDSRVVSSDGGRPPQRLVFTNRGVREFSWPEPPTMVERVAEVVG